MNSASLPHALLLIKGGFIALTCLDRCSFELIKNVLGIVELLGLYQDALLLNLLEDSQKVLFDFL